MRTSMPVFFKSRRLLFTVMLTGSLGLVLSSCSSPPKTLHPIHPKRQGHEARVHLTARSALKLANQILGATYDQRSDETIAADMQQKNNVVLSFETWQEHAASTPVDLLGWDDGFINHYRQHIGQVCTQFMTHIRHDVPRAHSISGRTKTLVSLIAKLKKKAREGHPLSINGIQDMCGTRIVLSTVSEVYRVVDQIVSQYKVLEKKDYIEHPKSSGYRSIHMIIEVKGSPIEIRIHTQGMQLWGQWSHTLYKPHKVIPKIGEAQYENWVRYAHEVSDYLFAQESGQQASKPTPPAHLNILWQLAPEDERAYMLPDGSPRYSLLDASS